jgi:hypothetical protein
VVPPLFAAALPRAASVRAPARVRNNGRSRTNLAGITLFAANSGGDFGRRRERFAATTASLPVSPPELSEKSWGGPAPPYCSDTPSGENPATVYLSPSSSLAIV